MSLRSLMGIGLSFAENQRRGLFIVSVGLCIGTITGLGGALQICVARAHHAVWNGCDVALDPGSLYMMYGAAALGVVSAIALILVRKYWTTR
jgi:hypothetical protein